MSAFLLLSSFFMNDTVWRGDFGSECWKTSSIVKKIYSSVFVTD